MPACNIYTVGMYVQCHGGIFFVSGYWEGSKAIRLGQQPADAKLIWEDERQLRGLMSQPLCRDGVSKGTSSVQFA